MDRACGILRTGSRIIVGVIAVDIGACQAGGLRLNGFRARGRPFAALTVGIGKDRVAVLIVDGLGGNDVDRCGATAAIGKGHGVGEGYRGRKPAGRGIGQSIVRVNGDIAVSDRQAADRQTVEVIVGKHIKGDAAVVVQNEGIIVDLEVHRLCLNRDGHGVVKAGGRDGGGTVRRRCRCGNAGDDNLQGEFLAAVTAGQIQNAGSGIDGRAVGVAHDRPGTAAGGEGAVRRGLPCRVGDGLIQRYAGGGGADGEVTGGAAVVGDRHGIGDVLDVDLIGEGGHSLAVGNYAGDSHGQDSVLGEAAHVQSRGAVAVIGDRSRRAVAAAAGDGNIPRHSAVINGIVSGGGSAVVIDGGQVAVGLYIEVQRELVDRVFDGVAGLCLFAGGLLKGDAGVGIAGRDDDHHALGGDGVVDIVDVVMHHIAQSNNRVVIRRNAGEGHCAGIGVDGHGAGGAGGDEAPGGAGNQRPVGLGGNVRGQRAVQGDSGNAHLYLGVLGQGDLFAVVGDLRVEGVGIAVEEQVIGSAVI